MTEEQYPTCDAAKMQLDFFWGDEKFQSMFWNLVNCYVESEQEKELEAAIPGESSY